MSIQKKEFNLSPSIDMNPELVKKLADLTNKIDKMERNHNKEMLESYMRVSKSRDHQARGSSPPR